MFTKRTKRTVCTHTLSGCQGVARVWLKRAKLSKEYFSSIQVKLNRLQLLHIVDYQKNIFGLSLFKKKKKIGFSDAITIEINGTNLLKYSIFQ